MYFNPNPACINTFQLQIRYIHSSSILAMKVCHAAPTISYFSSKAWADLGVGFLGLQTPNPLPQMVRIAV